MRRIIAIVATASAICACCNAPESALVEAEDPVALSDQETGRWNTVASGLNAAWVSTDKAYSRSLVPDVVPVGTMKFKAWKGERVSGELLLWTNALVQNVNCEIPALVNGEDKITTGNVRFVRYTLADSPSPECRCSRPDDQPAVLVPDMLDNVSSIDIEGNTVRPVWFTVDVPADAFAGVYTGSVIVKCGKKTMAELPYELTVTDRTLPSPDKWIYHLDLWQHPSAVARIRGLEEWSDAHFSALKEEMGLLADAGQKVITCTLNRDPWNHQCYDAYGDMILWTMHSDGSWSYDYTVFDKWVNMMMELGINKMINCYSMVPWECMLDYYDEAASEKVSVKAEPGTEMFEKMWRPFLADFKKHLAEKGWLEITNIAMDERSPEQMDAAARLLAECAPEMGFAIADNHESYKKYTMMRDVCVDRLHGMTHEDIVMRRDAGYNSTFYVCCSTHWPNTFTFSQPYEAELLIMYGAAVDYDGMLRWAYNSWPENPVYDSRFGHFASGDTYMTYPVARSSVRFEKMRDGIENAEKVRILRNTGDAGINAKLDAILQPFLDNDINNALYPWAETVNEAVESINNL